MSLARSQDTRQVIKNHFYILACTQGCCCLVAKSCLTLCNPMDCSLPGSPVHGILQARILEWVAISSSNITWGQPLKRQYSGSWWWTGRPGVLWFMESQRVGHDWATELTELIAFINADSSIRPKWWKIKNQGLALKECLTPCWRWSYVFIFKSTPMFRGQNTKCAFSSAEKTTGH